MDTYPGFNVELTEKVTLSKTNFFCQGKKMSSFDLSRGDALRSGSHKFLFYDHYYYSLPSLSLYKK